VTCVVAILRELMSAGVLRAVDFAPRATHEIGAPNVIEMLSQVHLLGSLSARRMDSRTIDRTFVEAADTPVVGTAQVEQRPAIVLGPVAGGTVHKDLRAIAVQHL